MGPAHAHDIMTTAEQGSYKSRRQLLQQLQTTCDEALTRSAGRSPRQAGDWGLLPEGPGKMSVAQVAALRQPQPICLMA